MPAADGEERPHRLPAWEETSHEVAPTQVVRVPVVSRDPLKSPSHHGGLRPVRSGSQHHREHLLLPCAQAVEVRRGGRRVPHQACRQLVETRLELGSAQCGKPVPNSGAVEPSSVRPLNGVCVCQDPHSDGARC